ncbi:MAG: hypothetical protein K2X47_16205 [Bdellovibrionales bacterium]|nr:hypothetical protein [Bdellovibrionales bacterium]
MIATDHRYSKKVFLTAGLLVVLVSIASADQKAVDNFLAAIPQPQRNAVGQLLTWEQDYVNRVLNFAVFTQMTGDANKLESHYYPENKNVFELEVISVPIAEMDIVGDPKSLPPEFVFVRDGKPFVRFPVHPVSTGLYPMSASPSYAKEAWSALALSSHRSIVAKDAFGNVQLLKVSLDREIGNVTRTLGRKWILKAVGISKVLKARPEQDWLNEGIVLIDEPVALIPKGVKYGTQLRTWPYTQSVGKQVIPMFALYSKETPDQIPILVKFIRSSGINAKEYVHKHIIGPLIRQYFYFLLRNGVVTEPHSQNILMEFKEGVPTARFWYRDFGGFSLDRPLHARTGLALPEMDDETMAGVSKVRYEDLAYDLETYMFHGNIWPMVQALKEAFPEITENWALSAFRNEVTNHLKRRYGLKAALHRNYNEVLSELKGTSKSNFWSGPFGLQSTLRTLCSAVVFGQPEKGK